jgi:NADH-quinone oxidoreductase subunit N
MEQVANTIELKSVLEGWGVFIFCSAISILGLIAGRVFKNYIISWISAGASLFSLIIYSIFGKIVQDPFGVIITDKILFASCLIISILGIVSLFVSFGELSAKEKLYPEYFFFLSLASIGGIIMTSSKDFLTLFISKEILSFPIYAMIYALRDRFGVESAFKYFVSSAVFSLFYLLGLGLIFASSGSIAIAEPQGILGLLGLYLILFDLFFKAGAAPFHFWVPDVYQGAPSSTVVFAGSVVKFSSFLAIMRIFDLTKQIQTPLLEIVVILSVIIGIFSALVQKELKRLIAYSSISHAGFISLILFGIGNEEFKNFFIFYLATYSIAFAGAFSILSLFKNTLVNVEDISGFSRAHRFFAAMLTIFFVSFAGLPPLAGFQGKYFAFITALSAGEILLVVISAAASIASLYFYFLPLTKSFIEEPKTKLGFEFSINPAVGLIVLLLSAITIYFGIRPYDFIILLEGIPLSF